MAERRRRAQIECQLKRSRDAFANDVNAITSVGKGMTKMRDRSLRLLALALTLNVFSPLAAIAQEQGMGSRAAPDGFTLAASGDLLGPYSDTLDIGAPGVAEIGKVISSADAAFANQEGSAVDIASFPGSLGAENGGGYPNHTLEVARSFKALGIDLLSRANNHATDYGIDGMLASDLVLDAIGFTHAGTGRSLEEARAPSYFQSSRGRVALVATASSFTGMSPAGDAARGVHARPGLNPLHVQAVTIVTPKEFSALKAIALRGGWQGEELPGPNSTELSLGDAKYRVGTRPGLTYDVNGADEKAILASVAQARKNADVVVFSIHAHETLSGGLDDLAPATFLQPLFHSVIDAGADAVVRHGPHSVMGVEIYHGKPIFYSLASLFMDLPKTLKIASAGPNPLTLSLPDSWFEGAVATSNFKNGRVSRITIYPLMLESKDGAGRGLPRLAKGKDATRILTRIQDGSKMFGTKISIQNDLGIIDVADPQ